MANVKTLVFTNVDSVTGTGAPSVLGMTYGSTYFLNGDGDMAIPAGGPAGSANSFTAIIDFSSTPSTEAQVDVTGQTSILSTSLINAWIMASVTSDNPKVDHQFAGVAMRLCCSTATAGTGFTVYGTSIAGMATGEFLLAGAWQ